MGYPAQPPGHIACICIVASKDNEDCHDGRTQGLCRITCAIATNMSCLNSSVAPGRQSVRHANADNLRYLFPQMLVTSIVSHAVLVLNENT